MAKRTPKSLVHQAAQQLSRVEADSNRADSSAWAACRALDELRDELPPQKFQEQLRAFGMSYAGAAMVAETFADRDDFLRDSAVAVAAIPEDRATTANLEQAHAAHLANPQTRTDLMRQRAGNKGWEGDRMAPLLDWIHSAENGLSKTVKGEAIARMDLYIKSGWAERDLGPQDDAPDTLNAGTLRGVFSQLRAGERVEPHAIKAALDSRWQELYRPLRVDKVEDQVLAYESGVSTFSMDGKGSTEGGSRIDAIIPDAQDPTQWHMAFASTGEDSRKQGDQMTRHVGGVITAMKIGAPPFEPDRHSLASISYYAPAIASESRAKAMDLTPKQQEAINRLALYAQLDDPYIRSTQGVGDAVLATAHYAIGAGKTTQASALSPDGPRNLDPAQHAKQAVGALKDLAQVDWHKTFKHAGEKSGRETIIPLAQAALDGLAKHYPETLPELKKAVPHLNRLAESDGIAGTGLERDLRTTALGLKHDKGQTLSKPRSLTEWDIDRLRDHMLVKQDHDSDRGVIHQALHRDVNAVDDEGNSALHLAASERDLQLVQKLLSRKADATLVNADGQSALHIAANTPARTAKSQADQAQVVALLAPTSDMDGQDREGNTALHLASAKGLDRAVGELLRHGADPAIKNNGGEKAVDLAQGYSRQVSSPNLRLGADRTAMTLEIAEQQRAMVFQQFNRHAMPPQAGSEVMATGVRRTRAAGL